jgi:threonine/homoserine/homoserine lactone efflux protein
MLREFLVIVSAHALAVMSPGPDLVVVMGAAQKGFKHGLRTSLGIAAGILVHVTLSLVGLAALLKSNADLFRIIQLLGGLYLLKLGTDLTRSSKTAHVEKVSKKAATGFLAGLGTNVLNPKATLFFLTVFTQVISVNTSGLIKVGYGAWMVLATFAWFALISKLTSTHKLARILDKYASKVQFAFGAVLLLIGIITLYHVLTRS